MSDSLADHASEVGRTACISVRYYKDSGAIGLFKAKLNKSLQTIRFCEIPTAVGIAWPGDDNVPATELSEHISKQ
jgi:hypothetical protein